MKLLVDMNLSPRWVELLRDAGWEAVHWSSVGKGDERDADIMAYAAERNYVVLTHDLDFSAILAATHGKKPSVVQARMEDVNPNAIGARVVTALRQTERDLEIGAVLTISEQQSRLRMLPINP